MRPLLDRRFYSLKGTLQALGAEAGDFVIESADRITLQEAKDFDLGDKFIEDNEIFALKGSQIVFKNSSDAQKASNILQSAGLKAWKMRQDEEGAALMHFAQRGAAESAARHLAFIFSESTPEIQEDDEEDFKRFDGLVLTGEEAAEVTNHCGSVLDKIEDLQNYLQTLSEDRLKAGDEEGVEKIYDAIGVVKAAWRSFSSIHDKLIV